MENWYKNYKFSGYVKPPEDIVNYIYERVAPYMESVWVNDRIKRLQNICKKIKNQERYPERNNGLLAKTYFENREYYEKSLKDFLSMSRESIGGIDNEIYKFIIPEEIVCRAIDCTKIEKMGIDIVTLHCAVIMNGRSRGTFHSNFGINQEGTIQIYPYRILKDLYNSDMRSSMSFDFYYLNILLGDVREVIGHELVHFMQDCVDSGLDENANPFTYGYPSSSIRNKELGLLDYWKSTSKNKNTMHSLTDWEFYPKIHDEISRITRIYKANKDFKLQRYIPRSRFLNELKANNIDKYEKAIKEIYKAFEQLKNNSET